MNILQLERKIRRLMARAYIREDWDHMDELWEIYQVWFPGECLMFSAEDA